MLDMYLQKRWNLKRNHLNGKELIGDIHEMLEVPIGVYNGM
jgi:hypothetical protein